MNTEELRKARIAVYKDVVKHEHETDKILVQGNVFNWRYLDAGCNLNECLLDYDVMYEVNKRFVEKYPHDVHIELGWRNPLKVTRSVGNETWIVSDDGEALSIKDNCFMEYEEYPELIENPMKFIWEKVIPRKSKYLQQEDNGKYLNDAIIAQKELGQYLGRITRDVEAEYGVPSFTSTYESMLSSYDPGHELLFNVLRGMKNIAMDMRRAPGMVEQAIEALEHLFMDPTYEKLYSNPNGTDPNACVDQHTVMLSHSILNARQFERFYWPYLKRMSEYLEKKDKTVSLYIESDSKRFWDYFAEFPKGRFLIELELDDLGEMKKALPNVALAGGFPTTLLAYGTKDECVDKCKECVENYAPGGGYIFSFDKCLAFKNDAKAENLQAVCEYMNSQWEN